MKAIIMAGGDGTRLRSVLPDAPKPMAPLLGVPVMQRIVELLRYCGVTEICATLRYMSDVIMSHFGDGRDFGVRMSYRIESEPLGTAGGVRACSDFYGARDFLVISGDAACDFDLRALCECHRRHGSAVTMALYEHSEPLSYGLVLTDKLGRITSFIEKPDWGHVVTDRVNTGIYVVSPRAMEQVPQGVMFDFARDLFPELLRRGETMIGLPMEGYWCDIGTPKAYYQCNLDALDGRLRLYGSSSAGAAPAAKPARVTVSCRDRARLMRRMSEALMEAGADFTDGLSVKTPRGRAVIRPSADEHAIYVESADAEVREKLAGLAMSME